MKNRPVRYTINTEEGVLQKTLTIKDAGEILTEAFDAIDHIAVSLIKTKQEVTTLKDRLTRLGFATEAPKPPYAPWQCDKCGFLTGTFGKKLEKWLPFLFSHDCNTYR